MSGHSYNSCLAKGLNSKVSLFEALVTRRTYPRCLVYDIHKDYNSITTSNDEKHSRRLVWRWGHKGDNWKMFGFVKMHLGDQLAATGLEVAKEIAAEEAYVDNHIFNLLHSDHGYTRTNT